MGAATDYLNRMRWINSTYHYRKGNKKLANKSTKVFVSGTLQWAKIVGDRALAPNYDGDAREWSFDLIPDDTTFLKEHKLLDRLKTDKDGNEYIRIKKPEFNKDGEKNEPFRIYDADDLPWGDDRLIGNGTRADVKLDIRDWGVGKKKSIYAAAIRVTEHVPYASSEFAGMDKKAAGDDKPVAKKASKPKTVLAELDELDDDVPFE